MIIKVKKKYYTYNAHTFLDDWRYTNGLHQPTTAQLYEFYQVDTDKELIEKLLRTRAGLFLVQYDQSGDWFEITELYPPTPQTDAPEPPRDEITPEPIETPTPEIRRARTHRKRK